MGFPFDDPDNEGSRPEVRADLASAVDQFEREYWPTLERRGFTLPQAFLAWQLHKVDNGLTSLGEIILARLDADD